MPGSSPGMMRTYLRGSAGRALYWYTLPAPSRPDFHRLVDLINAGIHHAASPFPGRVGVIDADAFFTRGDRFRDGMSYHGAGFTIHESDGFHLSAAGDQVAAALLVNRLTADHVLR